MTMMIFVIRRSAVCYSGSPDTWRRRQLFSLNVDFDNTMSYVVIWFETLLLPRRMITDITLRQILSRL